MLDELKKRYSILLNAVQFNEKYGNLSENRSIITGMKRKEDTIAYNVNKGYEIYIAIDEESDINSAMYVLLHEIAHSTLDDYDHSTEFWENFKELREIAERANIYTPIKESKYCGQTIKDSIIS
jgi:Zn-dependent peptidase ImmA (M78 family)